MLTIQVHHGEQFNEKTNTFEFVDAKQLEFEHSLSSISKWEADFQKPFISETAKTSEETVAYFRHMLLTPDVSDDELSLLRNDDIKKLSDYITASRTATVITERLSKKGPSSGEYITSEIIYYYMVALQIPLEAEHWHFNRLLTLIQVTNLKNQPTKKMSRGDAMSKQRAINEARKAKYGTTG